jgi:outer membrane protein OmpU
MNIKKIGLTALAASLVSVSAHAGEMSVAGSASVGMKHNPGTDGGKSITMGNQLTFTGSGELDNGLNVALSFVLDQGDDSTTTGVANNKTQPFDSHSITISSDAMGSFVIAGEGAGNAQTALDTTAAGDVWDNGFTYDGTAYIKMASSSASGSSINYTLPTLMDDLALAASYSPSGASLTSTTGYSLTYTGVEGLSVSYGASENGSTVANTSGDVTTIKASYALGSFTGAYSVNESDKDGGTDEEMTSFKLSYTVSDDLSVSYGEETHETAGTGTDEEFEVVSASYTTGGMTITAAQYDAANLANTAGQTAERWKLGLAFAF